MMDTIQAPVSAYTSTTAAPPGCQHSFAQAGPHYCSYIQVPGVLASLSPASTADEQLLISYLAACVLWMTLQQGEMVALEQTLSREQALSPEQVQLGCQRLVRCLTLAQTMQAAGAVVRQQLETSERRIGFRVCGDLHILPLYGSLAAVTTRVQRLAWSTDLHANVPEPPSWSQIVYRRFWQYSEAATEAQHTLSRVLVLVSQQPTLPAVTLDTLMPADVLTWADHTLRRHHPQTLTDASTTDPLVFIVAHQLFEVWFTATIRALEEATHCLTQEPPQVLEATLLIHRSAELVQLWQRMIHLPQTMSATDYIAFRAQLEGGSGAESEQFRQVELLAGLRERRYRQSLEQMSLLTPRLEALWQQTSLNDAIMGVLAARGILSPDLSPAWQAEQLAAIWLPTGTAHSHADLAALCQAALHLDEQFWLFRQHHLAMVRAMIGGKPSIGAGGIQNHELLTHDQEAQPVGGLPYLEQTTEYRLFPVISQALEHLQENWQAVAQVSHR